MNFKSVGKICKNLRLINKEADALNRPLVVTIDGPDKTGKSTTVDNLVTLFGNSGIDACMMILPGSTIARNYIVNSGITDVERMLFLLNDLADATRDVYMVAKRYKYKVIFTDRHPFFSMPVYNYPYLGDNKDNMISIVNQSNLDTFIIPDISIVFLHKAYKNDDEFIAKRTPYLEQVTRYADQCRDPKDQNSLGDVLHTEYGLFDHVPCPIGYSILDRFHQDSRQTMVEDVLDIIVSEL